MVNRNLINVKNPAVKKKKKKKLKCTVYIWTGGVTDTAYGAAIKTAMLAQGKHGRNASLWTKEGKKKEEKI